jgi:hypothetical protein
VVNVRRYLGMGSAAAAMAQERNGQSSAAVPYGTPVTQRKKPRGAGLKVFAEARGKAPQVEPCTASVSEFGLRSRVFHQSYVF